MLCIKNIIAHKKTTAPAKQGRRFFFANIAQTRSNAYFKWKGKKSF